MMIITMLMNLNDNDGLTLKKGEPITYKTGWQVADYGMETSNVNEAAEAVAQLEGKLRRVVLQWYLLHRPQLPRQDEATGH